MTAKAILSVILILVQNLFILPQNLNKTIPFGMQVSTFHFSPGMKYFGHVKNG